MITVLFISTGAAIATLLGGFFAIRFKDKLHLILGFSAGALLGAAFFDLLPESIQVGSHYFSISTMAAFAALGIFIYLIVDRCLPSHNHIHDKHEDHDDTARGNTGALTLVVHSLFDGIAIGLASFVPAALPVVAAAVLAHDFSDGINTVNLVFRNDRKSKYARLWLILDALAPIVGAVITRLFIIPEEFVAIALAILAGFFIYISLSDLIPESYHGHPTRWTTFLTILGAAVIFIAVRLAGL